MWPVSHSTRKVIVRNAVLGVVGFLLMQVSRAWAAPCCSAGSALPTIITNDDRAQLAFSYSMSTVAMDAGDSGPPSLRESNQADYSNLMRFSGAYRFADRFQLGVGTTLISRSMAVSGRSFSQAGFGDSDIIGGYELLPEWTYSELRPKGILYLQMVLPTGKAVQDPSRTNPADIRGQGVFQNVLALVLTKAWGSWDAYLVPEVRHLYARTFDEGTHLSGAWGTALQIGLGYSIGNLRFGLRTQPVYQGARTISDEGQPEPVPARVVWNTGADASFLLQDTWLIAAGYSDQTLLGPAKNTTLDRSVSFSLQKRWDP